MTPQTLRKYHEPLSRWAKDHGIDVEGVAAGDLSGAYMGESHLSVIEFCMHEIGHFLATGSRFVDMPKNLFQWVDLYSKGLSKPTADSWERDAAAITYLAGKKLRFWREARAIALSCLKNHQKLLPISDFDELFDKALHDPINGRKALEMATYIRLIRQNYNPKEMKT